MYILPFLETLTYSSEFSNFFTLQGAMTIVYRHLHI